MYPDVPPLMCPVKVNDFDVSVGAFVGSEAPLLNIPFCVTTRVTHDINVGVTEVKVT